jgi:hypothetical protein
MKVVPVDILLAAAKRSLIAWTEQEERVQSEQGDVIAALRNAVIAMETALESPVVVDIHRGCGGVLGYDAWVDSNSDVCGGPFDNYICMKCDAEEPRDVTRGVPDAG